MKHLLLTTIAAVLVVGCGESQQSAPAPKPEPPTAKKPDISIHKAAFNENIEAVKQHLAAGTDVNAKDKGDNTPLGYATGRNNKEIVELLITKGAEVNTKNYSGSTPLHSAAGKGHKEIAELLIAAGADVNAKVEVLGWTPLDATTKPRASSPRSRAILSGNTETAALLRKHGGKTGAELKAEGK